MRAIVIIHMYSWAVEWGRPLSNACIAISSIHLTYSPEQDWSNYFTACHFVSQLRIYELLRVITCREGVGRVSVRVSM